MLCISHENPHRDCNEKREPSSRRKEWFIVNTLTFASPIRFDRVAPNFETLLF
jgi:hypothetical protein